MTPDHPEPIRIALRVTGTLDALGVPYHVGGSLASSIHGVPRQTQDIDIVTRLEARHVEELVRELRVDFYVDEAAATEAVRTRCSFNVIHFDSGFKVDLFVASDTSFDAQEQSDAVVVDVGDAQTMLVKSPADTILRKLLWYRAGGELSERQWTDALEIARAQGPALDGEHLARWAVQLDLQDLVERLLDASAG